ncbi:hypothetical protein EDB87DRAFT_1566283, partial [Lactarius vividus]
YFCRYANCSAQFVHAYEAGLSGTQAAWENCKYHGHRTLHLDIVAQIKQFL